MFGGLKWRSVGPDRGGRSIAVAGSAARPLEYYFGATGGGLWKTTDGGTTWKPVADAFLKTSSVGAVAVAESNPDIVYVGMGEVQLRGNIIQGDGVYRTSDGGKTWAHVGLADSMAVARIRVHPKNPDLVYAAVLGNPYAATEQRGVFRSRDGGKTWDRVLFRDAKTGAVDLSMDPNAPDTLYAGLWEVFRTPHSLSSGGPGSGLFKSTDGGATWTELTKNPGLPTGLWGKVGVAVSPVDAKRVYAIVENENGGVFVSDDSGATWKQMNDERRLRQRAFYYTRIYADTKERDTVYVLNTGFYKSTDAGKTYRSYRVPHGDNHDLWIAPNDPKRMINGNDGGANVSVNGAESWTDQDFPTAQFYNVFTTTHVPYHVCGAQQDNSTACVSSAGDRRAVRRRRRRERLHRARPAQSRRVLRRQLRRASDALRPPNGRDAHDQRMARQPDGLLREGHRRAVPVDVPDRLLADRPAGALRRLAARVEDDERGAELGAHQPRSDAARPGDDGAVGRADHAGPDRRRDLRHRLHDCAVAATTARRSGRDRTTVWFT